MKPLVSVLIPAYNAGRSLGETLESACAQAWQNTEVIVVDDGSTDDTLRVANGFASRTVKVVRQDNRGAAAARNHLLSLAQGEYIQWLDADDLLSPVKISHQLERLEQLSDRRALVSSSWAYFRRRPQSARFVPGPLWVDLDPLEWWLRKWESNTFMQTATWLTSRELIAWAGEWHTGLSNDDDGEYYSRVLARASTVAFVASSRVYYRIAPPGRLSYIGGSSTKLDAMYRGMLLQIDLLLSQRNDDRAKRACATYIATVLPEFHGHRPDLAEGLASRVVDWGLRPPTALVPWKYRWIERVWGTPAARRAQLAYNRYKTLGLIATDGAIAALTPRYDLSLL